MSIRAYLIVTFFIYLIYFAGVVALLGGPQVATGRTAWQVLPELPLYAAAMTALVSSFANKTPPKERISFMAYRHANIFLGLLLATSVFAVTQL